MIHEIYSAHGAQHEFYQNIPNDNLILPNIRQRGKNN